MILLQKKSLCWADGQCGLWSCCLLQCMVIILFSDLVCTTSYVAVRLYNDYRSVWSFIVASVVPREQDELNRWTSSSKNKNAAKFQTSHAVCNLSTLINPKSHQTRAKFKCINISNKFWHLLLSFSTGMDEALPTKTPYFPRFKKVYFSVDRNGWYISE